MIDQNPPVTEEELHAYVERCDAVVKNDYEGFAVL